MSSKKGGDKSHKKAALSTPTNSQSDNAAASYDAHTALQGKHMDLLWADARQLGKEMKQNADSWKSWSWVIIFIALTAAAVATRLYQIDSPAEVVYDEVHYSFFLRAYTHGEYFFDLQPPLAKLLQYAVGSRVGFDGTVEDFNNIGNPFPNNAYFYVRMLSGFCGALCVPLTFLCVKAMRRSVASAVLAASFVLFEPGYALLSRLMFPDPILMAFILLGLYASLNLWTIEGDGHEDELAEIAVAKLKSNDVNENDASKKTIKPFRHEQSSSVITWFLYLLLAGVGMGGALASKWVGWGFTAPMFAIYCVRAASPIIRLMKSYYPAENDMHLQQRMTLISAEYADNPKKAATEKAQFLDTERARLRSAAKQRFFGLFIVAVFIVGIWVVTWGVHLTLLHKSGTGNGWHNDHFQASLKGLEHLQPPNLAPITLFEKIREVSRRMVDANLQSQNPHDWSSYWYQWPTMHKQMLYWVGKNTPTLPSGEQGKRPEIYLCGNAVVYAVTTLLTPLFALFALHLANSDKPLLSPRQRHYGKSGAWLMLLFLVMWVVVHVVGRSATYLHQYHSALLMAILLLPTVLDKYLSGWGPVRALLVTVLVIASGVVYLLHLPYITGTSPSLWPASV